MKKITKPEGQLTLAGTEEGEILARLNDRVEKAVRTIQELRKERDALKSQLRESDALHEEHERFQRERGEIRERIEGILANLEELDSSEE